MVDQHHNEYHLVRTIMLVLLSISLISMFVGYTTSSDLGITCTPTHQTSACTIQNIQNNTNSSITNLFHSLDNATTTPLLPVANNAAAGLGGIANIFIAIPNVIAHVFGWYNTNTGQLNGLLLSFLSILFNLVFFVLFSLFVFIPTVLASSNFGIFSPIFAVLDISATGIFIVYGLYLIINRLR